MTSLCRVLVLRAVTGTAKRSDGGRLRSANNLQKEINEYFPLIRSSGFRSACRALFEPQR